MASSATFALNSALYRFRFPATRSVLLSSRTKRSSLPGFLGPPLHLEATGLDVDQELPPALRALAQADLEADQLLPAFRRGSENDQHALGLRLHAGLQVDAVGPDADVSAGREIAALPAVVLRLPLPGQARDDGRRQVRRVLPQYGGQRSAHSLEPVALEGLTLKVARRDAAEVKHRQQGI